MRTLNVSISEKEFEKLGLKGESLTFAELFNLVSKELVRQNLEKTGNTNDFTFPRYKKRG